MEKTMKKKQITAILLSAVMMISACMPINISAHAADTAGEGNTEAAAVAELREEESAEEAEPEITEPAQEVQDELPGGTGTDSEVREEAEAGVEEEQSEEADAADEEEATEEVEAGDEKEAAEETEASEEPENNDLAAYTMESDGLEERKTNYAYVSVRANQSVTLSVIAEAADMNGITYKWLKDSKEIEGAVSAEYTTEPVRESCYYKCIVSDAYGNTSEVGFEVAAVNNLEAYSEDEDGWMQRTRRISLPLNETTTLSVIASANDMEGITYQWYGPNGYESPIEGADSASIVTGPVTGNQEYRCVVSDHYGSSCDVTFYITVDTHLEAYPAGHEGSTICSVYTNGAQSVKLKVIASADEGIGLNYEWYDINTMEKLNETSSEYTVSPISGDCGYECRVSDSYGNMKAVGFSVIDGTYDNHLIVHDPENVNFDRRPVYKVKAGGSRKLSVAVSANDQSAITFEWKKGPANSEADEEFTTIEGVAAAEYTIQNAQDNARYKCVVRDQYGSCESVDFDVWIDNELKVYAGKDSSSDYQQISMDDGQSLDLTVSVEAINTTGLKYQWYSGDNQYLGYATPIDGANSPNYHIASVKTPIYYFCEVEDQYDGFNFAKFYITEKMPSIEKMDVSLKTTAYTYDGKEKKPAVIVKYKGKALENDRDYKVTYSGNINAGTATAKITGITMPGEVSCTFKINKAKQSITAKLVKASIPVGKTTTVSVNGAQGKITCKSAATSIATATGTTVKGVRVGTVRINVTAAATANYNAAAASVTVKVLPAAISKLTTANQAAGIKLTWAKVAGANGYIIYRNNVRIKTITGGAAVTFTDTKANTNGTKYVFKVVAKGTTGTSTLSKTVTAYRLARPAIPTLVNNKARTMTAKWSRNAKGSGYQIQYSLKSSFAGAKTLTAAKNTIVTKSVTGLKKGSIYYVRVRTFKSVGSTMYYSAWSAAKKVKITK